MAVFSLEVQQWIPEGRIDLVLCADGRPIVAVENKIDAPLQPDQLARYGRWISAEHYPELPGVVCLLTHLTGAPEGFQDGGAATGGATPHLLSWPALSVSLLNLANSAAADVKLLATELFSFLGENGMNNEFAGRDDYAASIVYLRSGARMYHTFHSIYLHLKSLKGCFYRSRMVNERSLEFHTQQKLIWGYTFLTHSGFNDLFFGYGIALDPSSTFKQGRIPSRDSVFICVGAEDKRTIQAIRASAPLVRAPWTYAETTGWTTVVTFKPMSEFLEEPDSFVPKMKAWINDNAEDVNEFVSKLE